MDRQQSAGFDLMRGFRHAVAALLPLALLAGAAQAQGDRYAQPTPPVTGSIGTPSETWSGEPGASGHPLMMPDAILAAVADFKNCLERMWPDAVRRGITRASFERFTADLEPDVKIMDFVDAQPEFTKAFWDYIDLLVTDDRIAKGRELLATHATTFDAVEKAYGVDRHIIVAIWGVETKYGGLDGEPPDEGRLGRGPDLGLRGRAAAKLQLHAGRPGAKADRSRMDALRHHASGRRAVSARGRQGDAVHPGGRARPEFSPARQL